MAYGVMAQLVARLTGSQKVTSSNLVSSTKIREVLCVPLLFCVKGISRTPRFWLPLATLRECANSH